MREKGDAPSDSRVEVSQRVANVISSKQLQRSNCKHCSGLATTRTSTSDGDEEAKEERTLMFDVRADAAGGGKNGDAATLHHAPI